MHHRLLITAAAFTCLAGTTPALAQDFDWTGLYVGLNAGGSWGDTSLDFDAAPGTGAIVIPPADAALINQTGSDDGNKSGFTGGIQGGYNWQMGGLLIGIETDFGFMDIDQHRTNSYQAAVTTNPPPNPIPTAVIEQRVQADWVWTVRPRLGLVGGPWMVYATGGIATSKIDLDTKYADNRLPPNTASLSEGDTKTGWTAGIGGAYAFGANWSVRGEWLYVDFGKVKDTVVTTNNFATITSEAKVRANLLRLGVDYKF